MMRATAALRRRCCSTACGDATVAPARRRRRAGATDHDRRARARDGPDRRRLTRCSASPTPTCARAPRASCSSAADLRARRVSLPARAAASRRHLSRRAPARRQRDRPRELRRRAQPARGGEDRRSQPRERPDRAAPRTTVGRHRPATLPTRLPSAPRLAAVPRRDQRVAHHPVAPDPLDRRAREHLPERRIVEREQVGQRAARPARRAAGTRGCARAAAANLFHGHTARQSSQP